MNSFCRWRVFAATPAQAGLIIAFYNQLIALESSGISAHCLPRASSVTPRRSGRFICHD